MKRALFLLFLLPLPLLGACDGKDAGAVYAAKGREVGEVRSESDKEATVIDIYGQVRGHIRGGLVRNDSGGRAGTVVVTDGSVSIRDPNGKEIGQLKDGSGCVGPSGTQLGTVRGTKDPEAAAGACLLLLIQKELAS